MTPIRFIAFVTALFASSAVSYAQANKYTAPFGPFKGTPLLYDSASKLIGPINGEGVVFAVGGSLISIPVVPTVGFLRSRELARDSGGSIVFFHKNKTCQENRFLAYLDAIPPASDINGVIWYPRLNFGAGVATFYSYEIAGENASDPGKCVVPDKPLTLNAGLASNFLESSLHLTPPFVLQVPPQ